MPTGGFADCTYQNQPTNHVQGAPMNTSLEPLATPFEPLTVTLQPASFSNLVRSRQNFKRKKPRNFERRQLVPFVACCPPQLNLPLHIVHVCEHPNPWIAERAIYFPKGRRDGRQHQPIVFHTRRPELSYTKQQTARPRACISTPHGVHGHAKKKHQFQAAPEPNTYKNARRLLPPGATL